MSFSIRNMLVLLFCTVASAVFCSTVTVTVVQNEQAPFVALQMSQTVEDELMTVLFDSGHIVSNTSVRLDGSLFSGRSFGLKEAAHGLSDYLLVVLLKYNPSEKKKPDDSAAYAQLDGLSWRLVNVAGGAVLAEKTLDLSKIPITDFDPYKQSRQLADIVGRDCLQLLYNSSKGGDK